MPGKKNAHPAVRKSAQKGTAARKSTAPSVREDPQEYGEKQLRFIDLFCGIGGFRISFEQQGARCVFSSDYDKFSQQSYEANYGEIPHGDIHAVAEIPLTR